MDQIVVERVSRRGVIQEKQDCADAEGNAGSEEHLQIFEEDPEKHAEETEQPQDNKTK